jgi:hypothetical protein
MKSIIFFTSGLVGVSAEPVAAREAFVSPRSCSSNRACRSPSQCLDGNCEGIYINDSVRPFPDDPTAVEYGSTLPSCAGFELDCPPSKHRSNRYDNLLSLLSYGVSFADGLQSGQNAAATGEVPVQVPASGTPQRSGVSRLRFANILFAGVNVLSKLWKGNRSRALIDLVASLGLFSVPHYVGKFWGSDFGREFGLKKTDDVATAAQAINDRASRSPADENLRYRGNVALMQHIRRAEPATYKLITDNLGKSGVLSSDDVNQIRLFLDSTSWMRNRGASPWSRELAGESWWRRDFAEEFGVDREDTVSAALKIIGGVEFDDEALKNRRSVALMQLLHRKDPATYKLITDNLGKSGVLSSDDVNQIREFLESTALMGRRPFVQWSPNAFKSLEELRERHPVLAENLFGKFIREKAHEAKMGIEWKMIPRHFRIDPLPMAKMNQ